MAQQGTHSRIQPALASPHSAAPSPYQHAAFHSNPLQQDLNPYANYPIQPHLSSPASYRQGQHVPNPLARASSSFMPPPSSLPEEINKRRNLQPQRPHNLWPKELSEEQRQIQDQYVHNAPPINPYYAQQPPSTTIASLAPLTASTPPPGSQSGHKPYQQTYNPALTSHSTPPMTATSLPPAALPSTTQVPPITPASNSESAAPQSTKPASVQIPTSLPPENNSTQPQQPGVSNAAQAAPQPPSPFEAQRVSALLEINRFLLLELSSLQTRPASLAGSSPDDPAQNSQPRPNPQSSPHYVDYMRRLQSNLAYLASVADRPHKPMNTIPAWPAIMEPPSRKGNEGQGGGEESEAEKGVRERYEGLKELWPDWKGKGTS